MGIWSLIILPTLSDIRQFCQSILRLWNRLKSCPMLLCFYIEVLYYHMCHSYLRAECNSNLLIQVLTNKIVTDTTHLKAQSKHTCLITLILSTLFPLS